MFDALRTELVKRCTKVNERAEGVAFFKSARDLYRLQRMTYFCVDIPAQTRHGVYSHCAYSDTEAFHCVSYHPLGTELVGELGGLPTQATTPGQVNRSAVRGRLMLLPLRRRVSETGALEVAASDDDPRWATRELTRELRILASYFHSHVLHMSGHDAVRDMLMSAKALDCLKWTAAGKTAWEASVILGISERTVRFHLNAAREKLNCATTTQAVAKAIVNQLIDP